MLHGVADMGDGQLLRKGAVAAAYRVKHGTVLREGLRGSALVGDRSLAVFDYLLMQVGERVAERNAAARPIYRAVEAAVGILDIVGVALGGVEFLHIKYLAQFSYIRGRGVLCGGAAAMPSRRRRIS